MLKAIGLQIRLNGEYFSDHQIMQRSDFQGITGMVRSTAMIHIRRLRQEGKLQNIGIPSQPIYVPAPGFYGKSRDYQPVKKTKTKYQRRYPQITDIKKAAESMNLSFQGSLSAAISFQQAITENR